MSGPKIFTARLCEMGERFDPQYHSPLFSQNLRQIRAKTHITVGECCMLSEETWDRVTLFPETFPYIEIGAISNDDGEIIAREELLTSEAPSRAQMVIRNGDILVSMTRPTRNAIARVTDDIGIAIASTGFAVIRSVNSNVVLSDYLFHTLRLGFSTLQFGQRSSGVNYPAITKDDLRKILLPLPPRDVQARIVAELDAAYAAKRKADEKAAELLNSIDRVVLNALGIPPIPPPDTSLPARIFTVSSHDVTDRSFAPSHYLQKLDFSSARYECISFRETVSVDPLELVVNAKRPYHLVPMDAVSAEYGCIERTEEIPSDDMTGYTTFRNGDVIFAKISPCMENGKSAVVSVDIDGVVFGSTEFLVFRPNKDMIIADYLHLLLRLRALREYAGRNMSGTTGHQRVTKSFFWNLKIPVPPISIQKEIVDKVSAIRAEAKILKASAVAALAVSKKIIESILMEENKK